MKRLLPVFGLFLFLVFLMLVMTATTQAQNTITAATPSEQAKIKPLIDAETAAREKLNAKIATLAEAKAYNDAQAEAKRAAEAFNKSLEVLETPEAKAFRAAQAKAQKALEELNKATETLPENTAWKTAGAKALDEAYRLQAEHKLSSREYKPETNTQGDLVFVKIASPKP